MIYYTIKILLKWQRIKKITPTAAGLQTRTPVVKPATVIQATLPIWTKVNTAKFRAKAADLPVQAAATQQAGINAIYQF